MPTTWWMTAGLTLAAYLIGALPFGVWVGYVVLRRDVRAGGSGHSGATNTMRQAGWAVGALVLALDLAKGYAALWLAQRWLAPEVLWLIGAATVAGHCWPVWAQFRGGMGIATAGGAVLAVSPLGFVLGLGLLAAGSLALKHSARGNMAAGVLIGPVLWLFTGQWPITLLGAAVGLVIAMRSFSNWRRMYRELWLDRK